MLDELNSVVVVGTFDDLGTIEDLNKLGNKFDEVGPTGVEDSVVVDLEESCPDVNFERDIVSEDAIVNITLDGTTEHIVSDQNDILDDTPYLVSVQTDLVVEGLECNKEDEDSVLKENFKDSGDDSIGITEEITIDIDEGKGKGKGRGKGKGKGKRKGKGKSKVRRPRKQEVVEEAVEGSGVFDDVNECGG
ncbi:hypothetical protein RYX36_026201 [Vicia faba]